MKLNEIANNYILTKHAKEMFEYLVVSLDRFPYRIITFKEKSHNGIDIYSKRYLAQMGYCRKLFQ